jgi:hypothetical protein
VMANLRKTKAPVVPVTRRAFIAGAGPSRQWVIQLAAMGVAQPPHE